MGSMDELRKKYSAKAAGSTSAYDNASSEQRGSMLKYPGTFAAKVGVRAFVKDKELISTPYLKEASTGTVQYKMSFELTRPVGKARVGDFIYFQLPLWPGENLSDEKKQNIANLSKPMLATLTGDKNVNPTVEYVFENLLTEAEMKGDEAVITKRPVFADKEFLIEAYSDLDSNGNPIIDVKNDFRVFDAKTDLDKLRMEEISENDNPVNDDDLAIPVSEGEAPSATETQSEIVEDDLPF